MQLFLKRNYLAIFMDDIYFKMETEMIKSVTIKTVFVPIYSHKLND